MRLAALDGHVPNDKSPIFRSGDILIRRGAASIRANSGDVRRLFTNSIVHEERVRAVNELWNCLVEQRRQMGGVEYLYDIFAESEYPEIIAKPDRRAALGQVTEGSMPPNSTASSYALTWSGRISPNSCTSNTGPAQALSEDCT